MEVFTGAGSGREYELSDSSCSNSGGYNPSDDELDDESDDEPEDEEDSSSESDNRGV